jgi:hypothetical protein
MVTVAVLLRSLPLRRVRQGGVDLSLKKLLQALHEIREVVKVYASAGAKSTERTHPVLTTQSELQGVTHENPQLEPGHRTTDQPAPRENCLISISGDRITPSQRVHQ